MIKKQKGFTLIELLVVIAIIGILSTLAVISLNNAREKARDAKRVSDIKQIQTALELYFNDGGAYPGAVVSGTPITFGSTSYMTSVPSNPTPNGIDYNYTALTGNTSYTLEFSLEGATGGMASGAHTATPAGIN